MKMCLSSTLILLTWGVGVSAYPDLEANIASAPAHQQASVEARQASDFPAWEAPGPDDERGPCPGLNTMSNYGFLPHTGRGITLEGAIPALKTGLNFGEDIARLSLQNALAQCGALTNAVSPCESFDLSMLRHPHAIEHDGSMTRRDSNNGTQNNWAFDPKVFAQTLAVWEGVDVLNRSIVKRARELRQVNAKNEDYPGWYTERIKDSLFANALYKLMFGDDETKTARKDWIKFFFENEKLPLELGWSPNQRQEIDFASIAAEAQAIAAA